MFAWCASCQQFCGEREPFDDYTLTHGHCEACPGRLPTDTEIQGIRAIAAFYNQLLVRVSDGVDLDVDDVIAKGHRLGLRDLDLAIGILQPALYEIGRRWERGELPHHREAAFSTLCDEVLRRFEPRSGSSSPSVVLLNAHWNRHTLGVRMLGLMLRARGVDTVVLAPTPPVDQLHRALSELGPAFVGVSVATSWHLGFLSVIQEVVATLPHPPRIVAGGLGVANAAVPKGIEVWARGQFPSDLSTFQRPLGQPA